MTKRDIKIETLNIAGSLLTNVEVTLWDDEKKFSEEEQCEIVKKFKSVEINWWIN